MQSKQKHTSLLKSYQKHKENQQLNRILLFIWTISNIAIPSPRTPFTRKYNKIILSKPSNPNPTKSWRKPDYHIKTEIMLCN